jgi:hypothetical protein
MDYISMLKKIKKHAHAQIAKTVEKGEKGGFDSFDSGVGCHFPEKTAAPTVPQEAQNECPLVLGGFAPPECRYTHELLIRMIKTGALLDPDTGCPLRRVCELGTQLDEFDELSSADKISSNSRTRNELSSANELSDERPFCLGVHCDHAGYRQHDGIECKWCGEANEPVIDLAGCPSGHWHRDGHGMPVLGARAEDGLTSGDNQVTTGKSGPPGDCER